MTHARACCCSVADPCDLLAAGTHALCLRLQFQGIQANPWRLTGGNCFDDCSFSNYLGGATYVTDEVRTLAGVNRTFRYLVGGGIQRHPANIRFVRINQTCTGYARDRDGNIVPFGDDEVDLVASADCLNAAQRLRLSSVRLGAVFQWLGLLNLTLGQTITVGNQNACYTVGTGPFAGNRWGPIALNGVCQVTPELVAIDDLGSCQEPEPSAIARTCDGSRSIPVDLSSNPGGFLAVRYDEDLFELSSEVTNDPPIAVDEWVNELCDDSQPSGNKLATRCRGVGEIGVDPATIPPGARTCVHNGERYDLTQIDTTLEAQAVQFSTRSCLGVDMPGCTDIVDENDPRCEDPIFGGCPKCLPDDTDAGGPSSPGESPSSTADDDGELVGLGDLVARAIAFLKLDKLVDPERCGCERRRLILNRFGQLYGRAIIRRLGL